ncbi:MAG: hypothetical protein NVSMB6_00730 [Burkholderiaceae bacterium]
MVRGVGRRHRLDFDISFTLMKITNTFPESIDVQSDQINTRDIVVAPAGKTNTHNHHDREFWRITAGEGLLSSGSRQVTIRPGDHLELTPFEAHTVANKGTEELRFTTYWYADWNSVLVESDRCPISDGRLIIETAFPTPNGPLHLGHLSGAYLISDIFQRCCELIGTDSFSYCGTYGHTNHIEKMAIARDTTYADLVARSEHVIRQDLELFQAHYDDFLPHAPTSAAFEATKSKFINTLISSPHLVEREVEHPYSESSQSFVSESYVSGQCPHCGGATIGIECESCGLYQDECNLITPFHSVTKEPLVHRRVKRLYLRLDRDILDQISVQIYSDKTAASRICYDNLQKYLKNGALRDIPVSSLRGHGVPVHGDQVLSVVMERALRSYHGLSQYTSATSHLFFCGFDNLCGSGILMPYVLKILGIPDAQLPVAVINNFCLLDNRKFSTGANHAIWANEFLRTYPSDVVRLYLAKIHHPTSASNFRVEAFFDFSGKFIEALGEVFEGGGELAAHYTLGRIEAGPWLRQDLIFYRELNDAMRHCIDSYASHAPGTAVRRIEHLLESITDYIAESRHYREEHNFLRTRLALLLYAYQCLAYCLYPVMPALSADIMDCLGIDRRLCHAGRREIRPADRFDVGAIMDSLNQMKKMVQH